MPFSLSDLQKWRAMTGGRLPKSRTPQTVIDVDLALEAAINATNNVQYRDRLRTLGDTLKAVKTAPFGAGDEHDRGLWNHAAPLRWLFDQVTDEKQKITVEIAREARYAEGAIIVNIVDWLNANLPLQIVPNAAYNAIGEDAQLRGVRRACIMRQLAQEHQKPIECRLDLIVPITRSYLDAQHYWAPGQRCHFVVMNGGIAGDKELRQVESVNDQQQQIEEYVKAVFHKQVTYGKGTIKHSVINHKNGRITDPTWLQFFPRVRPEGRFSNIFSGTEAEFRAMFG